MTESGQYGRPRIVPLRTTIPIAPPALIRHIAFWRPNQEREPWSFFQHALTLDIKSWQTKRAYAKEKKWIKEIDIKLATLFDRLAIFEYEGLEVAHLLVQSNKRLKAETRVPGTASGATGRTGSARKISCVGRPGPWDRPQVGHRYLVLFQGIYDITDKCYWTDTFQVADQRLEPHRFRIIDFEFRWLRTRAILRFELHQEYLATTIVIDASEVLRGGDKLSTPVKRNFMYLKSCLTKLSVPNAPYGKLADRLYNKIPEMFYKEILRPNFPELSSDGYVRANLGELLVDFRTIIAEHPKYPALADFVPAINWAPVISEVVKPFIKAHRQSDVTPADADFTVSQLLDGNVIYATALDPEPEDKPHALRGLYYGVNLDPIQAGLLVATFHDLGTFRLAATRYAVELYNLDAKIGSKKLYVSAVLKERFETRIEQSRSYVKRWNEDIGFLRIKRIDGHQPYSEFVTRRFGPIFDHIDRLGQRHDHMINTDTQQEIAFLQRAAEFLGLMVLAPYYSSQVFVHSCALHETGRFDHMTIGRVWAVFFFGFAAFAIGRRLYVKRSRRPEIWDTTFVLAGLAIAFVVWWFGMKCYQKIDIAELLSVLVK